MGLPTNIAAYDDCAETFRAAKEHGGLTLTFASSKDAGIFVSRMNQYRILLRAKRKEKGGDETSPYDRLMVRHILDENRKRTPVVVIEPRGFNALSITTPDGKPVALDKGDSNFAGVTPVQVQDPHFDQEQEDAFLREFLGKDGE